jgi:fibronectin-binding autotransporter adhesin
MKNTKYSSTSALLILAMASSSQAQTTYTFSANALGAYNWNAPTGSGWDLKPASASDTTLNFSNGTSALPAAQGTSTTLTANNDIPGVLQLNALNMTYRGPASGTAPSVLISGNQLDFRSNGLVNPTLLFNTAGNVMPSVTISSNILFTNTAAITTTSNATFSGVLSGAGGFTKAGSGTLIVQNTATATGGTALGNIDVSAGTLQIGANGGFGSLGKGTITLSGSGSLNIARASNSFNLDNTITGSTSGTVNFNLNNSATSTAFAVTLTQRNTYTAATNLQAFAYSSVGAPTLKNGIDNALSTTTALTINTVTGSTAVMTYDLSGFNQTIGSLASGAGVSTTNGIVTNSGTAKTLTISNATGSTTFAGRISGNVFLTKSGASTQILSGTNTYSGDTIVEQGTLALSGPGSINSSALTVGSSATFRNTGVAYSNALKVAEGALFTGTTSAFTPTSLTLTGDLTDSAFTSVNFVSSLTKDGTLTVNLTNIAAGDYTLISSSTLGKFTSVTVTGTSLASSDDNSSFTGDSGTFRYTYSNVNNLLKIENLSAIPEPSTYAALAGLAILGFALRRRSKA